MRYITWSKERAESWQIENHISPTMNSITSAWQEHSRGMGIISCSYEVYSSSVTVAVAYKLIRSLFTIFSRQFTQLRLRPCDTTVHRKCAALRRTTEWLIRRSSIVAASFSALQIAPILFTLFHPQQKHTRAEHTASPFISFNYQDQFVTVYF